MKQGNVLCILEGKSLKWLKAKRCEKINYNTNEFSEKLFKLFSKALREVLCGSKEERIRPKPGALTFLVSVRCRRNSRKKGKAGRKNGAVKIREKKIIYENVCNSILRRVTRSGCYYCPGCCCCWWCFCSGRPLKSLLAADTASVYSVPRMRSKEFSCVVRNSRWWCWWWITSVSGRVLWERRRRPHRRSHHHRAHLPRFVKIKNANSFWVDSVDRKPIACRRSRKKRIINI